jgi:hypothetical protein
MGMVRFALRFPYTFYVLAAFILFLGVSAIKSFLVPSDVNFRLCPNSRHSSGYRFSSLRATSRRCI